MKNTLAHARKESDHWEPKTPFDLAIVYEDNDTRHRALHLYDHFAQQLLDDYDFQCTWWRIDHLEDSALRSRAADAAADANMIVLSLRAQKDLPAPVKSWMGDWLSTEDYRKRALVALIGNPAEPCEDSLTLQAYLQKIARQARMDFFPHAFAIPTGPRETSFEEVNHRVHTVTPILQGILKQRIPIPRWGINE